MAAIHAAAFVRLRPWTAEEFAALLSGVGVFVVSDGEAGASPPHEGGGKHPPPVGFLLGRALAGEAEVLTLAVRPGAQGKGLGGALMARFLAEASARGAARAFLEVAADNDVARRLYGRHGFTPAGVRRGYFPLTGGGAVDGIIMARDLPVF
jgi:ribosomal-protein-alanine N-acetyltransferase